jgi:Na+-driven multidrug efflux pump
MTLEKVISDGETDGAISSEVDVPIVHSYRSEVITQIKLALPVVSTFIMRKSVDIVSVMFVGRLGSHYLSAAGIAAVTSNVTGNSMILGELL